MKKFDIKALTAAQLHFLLSIPDSDFTVSKPNKNMLLLYITTSIEGVSRICSLQF